MIYREFSLFFDISIILRPADIWFSGKYPKFWFRKIFSDLNLIYKIPKFHIASAHLINFQSSQISPSGSQRVDQ